MCLQDAALRAVVSALSSQGENLQLVSDDSAWGGETGGYRGQKPGAEARGTSALIFTWMVDSDK